MHKDEQLRTLVWAGDRGILWVKDNDVYYRRDATSTGPDFRITSTGEENIIFNGIPDWVYEGQCAIRSNRNKNNSVYLLFTAYFSLLTTTTTSATSTTTTTTNSTGTTLDQQ